MKSTVTSSDPIAKGYIFFHDIDVTTECGGGASDSNQTRIVLNGFPQPVVAESFTDVNGYGIRINITGDWEAEDFMRALKDVRRFFKQAKRVNSL